MTVYAPTWCHGVSHCDPCCNWYNPISSLADPGNTAWNITWTDSFGSFACNPSWALPVATDRRAVGSVDKYWIGPYVVGMPLTTPPPGIPPGPGLDTIIHLDFHYGGGMIGSLIGNTVYLGSSPSSSPLPGSLIPEQWRGTRTDTTTGATVPPTMFTWYTVWEGDALEPIFNLKTGGQQRYGFSYDGLLITDISGAQAVTYNAWTERGGSTQYQISLGPSRPKVQFYSP